MGDKGHELPEVIASEPELQHLVRILSNQRRVAVDTESNSLHAYRERVCLIQFSTSRHDYIVDPLALDDLNPLGPIFADRRIEKVFHAAEYDLVCLRRDFGYSFVNIFDTMQAARILGQKQVGLEHMLQERFGVTVNKRLQKADWAVRPLAPDLLRYASTDTHYLIELRDLLYAELREHDLWQLAQEDFRMACNGNGPKPKLESPAWMHFSVRRGLSLRDLTILDELLTWREQIAARLDRPVFKVMDDDTLLAIAQSCPSNMDELGAAGVAHRQVERWGRSLLDAVARGLRRPLVQKVTSARPAAVYLKRLEKLKDWRKKAAAGLHVESDIVLPRSLLLALAEGGPTQVKSVMAASPWRLRRFGDQILEVLGGATA